MKNIFILITIVFVIASCRDNKESFPGKYISATVNNEILTEEELSIILTEKYGESVDDFTRNKEINNWVNLTLLAQEADNLNLTEDTLNRIKIENAIKKVKANILLNKKIQNLHVPEEDLFNYYKLNIDNYQKATKQYRLQQIYITDEEKLIQVRNEIINGLNFNQAAFKYSEESASQNEGIIGYVSKEDVHPEIWNRLENLRRFYFVTVSLDEGYYLIRHLNERLIDQDRSFNEVKDEIYHILREERAKDVYDNVIDNLRKRAHISIQN